MAHGRPDLAVILQGSFGSSGRPCVYTFLLEHHGRPKKHAEAPSPKKSPGQGSRPLHLKK